MPFSWLDSADDAYAAVVAGALAAVALWAYWSSSSAAARRLPPSPRRWPLLGHLPLLASTTETHRLINRLADKLGPIYYLKLGSVNAVVISNEDIAKEAMVKRGKAYAGRWPSRMLYIASENGHSLVMAPYGPYWRKMRKIAHKVLTPLALNALDATLDKESRRLVEYLHIHSAKFSKAVDVAKLFHRFTANIVLTKTLGICYADIDDPELENLLHMAEELLDIAGVGGWEDYFLLDDEHPPARISSLNGADSIADATDKASLKVTENSIGLIRSLTSHIRRLMFDVLARQKLKRLDTICGRLQNGFVLNHILSIKRRIEQENTIGQSEQKTLNEDMCFTEKLVREMDTLELTIQDIKNFVVDIVVAGIDTTGVTLTWIALYLCNDGELQRKAQQEIDRVTDNRSRLPTLDDMHRLPYVRAIIKEVLRLQPVGPLGLPRVTLESTELAGYNIPYGTQVILNLKGVHRDAFSSSTGRHSSAYPAPLDEFQPERFLTSASTITNGDNELDILDGIFTFGQGRRMCPGIHLAYREMFIMVARLLFSFDLMPCNGNGKPIKSLSTENRFGLTVMPKESFTVMAKERETRFDSPNHSSTCVDLKNILSTSLSNTAK